MLGRLYLRRHTRRHPRWSSRGCQRRLPKWRGRYQPTWAGSPARAPNFGGAAIGAQLRRTRGNNYQRSLLSIVGLSCTTAGAAAHSPLPSVVLTIRHPRTVPRRVVRRARFAARARRLEVMKPYRHRGRLVIGEARHELLEHCPAYQCQCQRQGIESAAAVLFHPRLQIAKSGRSAQSASASGRAEQCCNAGGVGTLRN